MTILYYDSLVVKDTRIVSRSHQRTPVFGSCGQHSERFGKRLSNHRQRTRLREQLAHEDWEAVEVPVLGYDIAYNGAEDGKGYQPWPMSVYQTTTKGIWNTLEQHRRGWERLMRK